MRQYSLELSLLEFNNRTLPSESITINVRKNIMIKPLKEI